MLPKAEFLRILRTITTRPEEKANTTNEIYENFAENFFLTGVIKDNEQFVDFAKFKSVFNSFKMNILDLLDFVIGNF